MKKFREHSFYLATVHYMAQNESKMGRNSPKLTKIVYFRHFWLKFRIFPAFNQAKINKMCRNSEIYVESTIFYSYKSLLCSKVRKKYEKLAKMIKNGIFDHFCGIITEKYDFSRLKK